MKELKRRHTPYTKFKAYLFENGCSQQELATMLGKSRYAVNQNLNGTGGDFSLKEVRKMCAIFSIPADDFFIYPQVSKTKQSEEVTHEQFVVHSN
ncbi:helix-turn-helix transcriptional regulator [Paenibacillus paeoniae]|uniref:XRE family transcriptional regulator n=1 Tax=Paenibacillus paeoniae TaxID=2292705 RepID=A0A371P054_9BACL|nr:helix-turn-helix domain-containing protein [Paenibacillus paeoniae]REK69312.1 XRE family transcriptional regulator [Paenibacillus paeoniae]